MFKLQEKLNVSAFQPPKSVDPPLNLQGDFRKAINEAKAPRRKIYAVDLVISRDALRVNSRITDSLV